MRMVSASARRIEALKRNIFHANGYLAASVVDCPKATPLGNRGYWKWVFPGILKFIRLHSVTSAKGATAASGRRAKRSHGYPGPAGDVPSATL